MNLKIKYDAVVVGSGPNGFAAAITMQRAGLSVLIIEAKRELGGGVRSAELTLPGFIHDVCSTVFPLGEDSPVFKPLGLEKLGLQYLQPQFAVAHPLDDRPSVAVQSSIEMTAAQLGKDAGNYKQLYSPFVNNWSSIRSSFLGPLHLSNYSHTKARFAIYSLSSGSHFAKKHFITKEAQALFAGMAAHSMLPLNSATVSSIAIVLNTMAHVNGWPLAKGGSQKITDALAAYFKNIGGEILTENPIYSLKQLPAAKAILLDVTPAQLIRIAGERFSPFYKWQLNRYEYGAGVFKIDWALSQPVPFTDMKSRSAGTVHLGGSLEEIYQSEDTVANKKHPEKPFVLFVQPSVVDNSRAPYGKHTAWAYCHVPNGSIKNMTDAIEMQVERFAPGFKDCILGRHTMNTSGMEDYNSNYIGGDINGGSARVSQLFTRPALRISPYRTSANGIYICSSSTPPGGGVHGICGYYAARRALKDIFNKQLPWL